MSIGTAHQVLLHGEAYAAYILALLMLFPAPPWKVSPGSAAARIPLLTVGAGTLLLVGFGTALLPPRSSPPWSGVRAAGPCS